MGPLQAAVSCRRATPRCIMGTCKYLMDMYVYMYIYIYIYIYIHSGGGQGIPVGKDPLGQKKIYIYIYIYIHTHICISRRATRE